MIKGVPDGGINEKLLPKQAGESNPDLRGLLLVVLVASWLAGIILSSWLVLPQAYVLSAAVISLLAIGVCWRKPTARMLALALLCLCLGAWRYAMVAPGSDPSAVRTLFGAGKLQLQGNIADEPRLENHSTLLTVTVQSVSRDQGSTWQPAHGTISVQAPGAAFDDAYGPHYGDSVQLTGQLTAPPSYSTPETQASMAFPQLTVTNRGGNPLLVALYQFRTTLAGILMQSLPQPFAALILS